VKQNKRYVMRSMLATAALACLAGGALAQGTPVKIGLLATLEGPFAAGGAAHARRRARRQAARR
jgi:branched-chain amino acid transport system substrate-binding protein